MNIKSAERTLQILDLVAERPRSHVDLANDLHIPRSSLTGLLRTIAKSNYLVLDPSTRKYHLGPQVLRLAQRYLAELDLVRVGQSALRAVTRDTGEATALVVRAGDEILVVAKENAEYPIKRSLQLGERAPLSFSAAGRVILAFMPDEERRAIIERNFRDSGVRQDGIAKLEAHLREITNGAVAYSREELLPGIIAMAVPVVDASGRLVGSLSVSAPASRFDPALELRIEQSLLHNAHVLSEALGARIQSKTDGGYHDIKVVEVD